MANDSASFMVALIDRVSGPARKMQGALGRLQKSIKNVMKGAQGRDPLGKFTARSGGMLKTLQSSFKGAGKRFGDAVELGIGKLRDGFTIGAAAVAGVSAGIGYLSVKMADFAQRSKIGFESVAKHGASAEKLFAHARKLATDLGLELTETTKTFTKFLALQFDPKMATDLIKMGSDLRAFGASGEEVQRIFTQLGQIQAKGKLQGEELIVLAENGISTQLVYEQLSKTLGKTKDEIMKMQSAGKLTSDMAFPAIIGAVMQKTGTTEVGQVGKKIADTTLGGMWEQLKANAQNAFTTIGEQAAPALTRAMGAVSTAMNSLLSNPNVQGGIVAAIETVSNLVVQAIPYVQAFIGAFAQGFSEAWPAMKETIGIMLKGFGNDTSVMDRVKAFATTLGQVAAFAVALGAAFGIAVVGTFELAAAVVRLGVSLWNGLIDGIGAAIFAVGDFFANLSAKWEKLDLAAAARSMLEGFVNGIKNGAQWVLDSVTNLGKAVIGKFESVLRIGSPSKEFAWLGEMSGLGFTKGLTDALAANDNGPKLSSFTGELEQGPVMSSFRAGDVGYGGAGGGGNVHVRFAPVFHINASDAESGKELADEIETKIRKTMFSVFEQLDLETG